MLGLFLDLMKITAVIESLSVTKPHVVQRELFSYIYYQQNEKSTESNTFTFLLCKIETIYVLL